jgi:hypothetical protein
MYSDNAGSAEGFIREDSAKKIYFLKAYPGSIERTIFDFGVNIGDSVKIVMSDFDTSSYVLTISDIESIPYAGRDRKRYHVSWPGGGNLVDYWLEGVGSLKGGPFPENCFIVGAAYKLIGFDEKGLNCSDTSNAAETSLNETPVLEIGPNPFSGAIRIDIRQKSRPFTVNIYTVKGQRVDQITGLPGKSAIWSAGRRPMGIYIAEITVNSHQYFRRLVLIK